MPKPLRQIGPSRRRAEVFAPDRYGYGERMRRALEGPTRFDLIVRVWWWCICGLSGALVGLGAIVVIGMAWCALTAHPEPPLEDLGAYQGRANPPADQFHDLMLFPDGGAA